MTYLKMYCNSFSIVLNISHSFSIFEETLTHFNHILNYFDILYVYYYDYYITIIILKVKKKVEKKKESRKRDAKGG